MGTRVEQFAAIRGDAPVEGMSTGRWPTSIRCTGRTVRQALASAIPPPRKTSVGTSRRLEPYKPAIDDVLRSDLDAPRKQRHTARRVLARLVDEHGANDMSYSMVRAMSPVGVRRSPPRPAQAGVGGGAAGGGVAACRGSVWAASVAAVGAASLAAGDSMWASSVW